MSWKSHPLQNSAVYLHIFWVVESVGDREDVGGGSWLA